MFDLKQFIEDCKGKPASAVKDLIQEALRSRPRLTPNSRVGIFRKVVSPI